MIHVVDKAGRIIAQLTEGSETAWYESRGYSIITGAEELAEISEWRYEEGELKPISDAERLARAKAEKLAELKQSVNAFVERKPDGSVRYDTALKLNLVNAAIAGLAAGSGIPEKVQAVQQWIAAVQGAYFERKGAIEQAGSLAELEQVDVSYEWFEARYGAGGSQHPDPDVYASDLVLAGA